MIIQTTLLCPSGYICQQVAKLQYVKLEDLPNYAAQPFVDGYINVITHDDIKRWRRDGNLVNITIKGYGINYNHPEPHYREKREKSETYPMRHRTRINIMCFVTKEECEAAMQQRFVEFWSNKFWNN